jgi:hypothetical protein
VFGTAMLAQMGTTAAEAFGTSASSAHAGEPAPFLDPETNIPDDRLLAIYIAGHHRRL